MVSLFENPNLIPEEVNVILNYFSRGDGFTIKRLEKADKQLKKVGFRMEWNFDCEPLNLVSLKYFKKLRKMIKNAEIVPPIAMSISPTDEMYLDKAVEEILNNGSYLNRNLEKIEISLKDLLGN